MQGPKFNTSTTKKKKKTENTPPPKKILLLTKELLDIVPEINILDPSSS
jgi:hypothetical protein